MAHNINVKSHYLTHFSLAISRYFSLENGREWIEAGNSSLRWLRDIS